MTMAGLGGGNKCSNIFEAFQDCQKVTAFKGGLNVTIPLPAD